MRARAELTMALQQWLKDERLTVVTAAGLLGMTQRRISDLMRGRIKLFSTNALTNMAAAARLSCMSRSRCRKTGKDAWYRPHLKFSARILEHGALTIAQWEARAAQAILCPPRKVPFPWDERSEKARRAAYVQGCDPEFARILKSHGVKLRFNKPLHEQDARLGSVLLTLWEYQVDENMRRLFDSSDSEQRRSLVTQMSYSTDPATKDAFAAGFYRLQEPVKKLAKMSCITAREAATVILQGNSDLARNYSVDELAKNILSTPEEMNADKPRYHPWDVWLTRAREKKIMHPALDWAVQQCGFKNEKLPATFGTSEKADPPAHVATPAEEQMKRKAVVRKLERDWPTIDRDLRDASRSSELRAAKVPNKHGYWYVERLKAWARANGKITTVQGEGTIPPQGVAGQLIAATRTHRIL